MNIDGEIIKLSNTDLTRFNTDIGVSSAKTYTTDFKVVDRIINSKRTWVRLSTSKGYVEAAIIDGGKVYDELRRDYLNRSFLFPCSDEKTDDNFNPFSDEAYIKMKSLHDERDNINFKNKMKEIKRNLSTSQKKEVEKIMKNKIK